MHELVRLHFWKRFWDRTGTEVYFARETRRIGTYENTAGKKRAGQEDWISATALLAHCSSVHFV